MTAGLDVTDMARLGVALLIFFAILASQLPPFRRAAALAMAAAASGPSPISRRAVPAGEPSLPAHHPPGAGRAQASGLAAKQPAARPPSRRLHTPSPGESPSAPSPRRITLGEGSLPAPPPPGVGRAPAANRLDDIAREANRLTYGDMTAFAEGVWKAAAAGAPAGAVPQLTARTFPAALYRWATASS